MTGGPRLLPQDQGPHSPYCLDVTILAVVDYFIIIKQQFRQCMGYLNSASVLETEGNIYWEYEVGMCPGW